MADNQLHIVDEPELKNARMVLGFSGWMDGGSVSTGTVDYLIDALDADPLAEIDPSGFYILNVPGSMEISALFRPYTRIENGIVKSFELPANDFYYSLEHNLILFSGKEPNLHWKDYADCIFSVAERFNVQMMTFIGSVSSLIPHTREPRFHCSMSDESLRADLEAKGLNPTNYEGPASMVTYLVTLAQEREIPMATVVAEIPGYIQGKNLKSMASVGNKLASVLELDLDLAELERMGADFMKRLDKIVLKRPDMAAHIRKLEVDYDKEVSSGDDEELRDWFGKQDIQLN